MQNHLTLTEFITHVCYRRQCRCPSLNPVGSGGTYPRDRMWMGSCSSFEPATSRQHLIKLVTKEFFYTYKFLKNFFFFCCIASYNVHLKHYTMVTVGEFKNMIFFNGVQYVLVCFMMFVWALDITEDEGLTSGVPRDVNKSEWMKNSMHDVLSKINLTINVNNWTEENSLLAS